MSGAIRDMNGAGRIVARTDRPRRRLRWRASRRVTTFTLATRFPCDDRRTRPGRHRRARTRRPSATSAPPLLVLEPLAAFLDEHGLGAGPLDGRAGRRRPLERDLPRAPRGPRGRRLRRPPRPPLPPERARRAARGAAAARDRRAPPRASRTCSRSATTRPSSARRSTSWSASRGEVITNEVPAALDTPAERRRIGEELVDALVEIHAVDWQACGLEGFGKPTGYLERQLRRFGGLWEHNRTREVAGRRARRRVARRAPARVRPGDDRPRRLPPRQRDVRARRAGAPGRGLRLGDGDDRRPARRRRLPRARRGARPTTRRSAVRARARHPRRGLPDAAPSSSPATRSARARDVRDLPLVHDARAVEVGRVHGGQLPPRASRAAPTTRT